MAAYPGGLGFGGLGYSSSSQPSDGAVETGTNNGTTSSVAGDMLQNLMQQCLAYHHDQQQDKPPLEQQQQQQRYGECRNLPQHEIIPQHETAAAAAAAPAEGGADNSKDLNANIVVPETIEFHREQQQQPPLQRKEDDIDKVVQEGRSRANAILEKFQQLTRDHGAAVTEHSGVGGGHDALQLLTTTTAASDYREKREAFFVKENKRKKAFFVKNLEYVSRRDAQRLQHQMAQIKEARQWEDQVQHQYQHVLEQRKKKLLGGGDTSGLTTQAGIGTAKRKRVETEKTRAGHAPSSRHIVHDSSVAVYLSGIPTDGSVPEPMVHQLFSSYGKIRKVHFYKHKGNGQLKGDALVVYDIGAEENGQQFVQSVCSQMNGAELACGSILQVMPADSSYGQSKYAPPRSSITSSTNNQKDKANDQQPAVVDNEEDKKDDADDSDLDDFFDSLA